MDQKLLAKYSFFHYIDYIGRKFCSMAPYLNVVPKAGALKREPGISALVRLRNEPWVEPSLLSIKNFADEIVVIDSSTDDTPSRVKKATDKYELPVTYIRKMCNLLEASVIALKQSRCEWVIRWDGDFVAYTCGDRNIANLKKHLIERLPRDKYYSVEFPHICLDLDLHHVIIGDVPTIHGSWSWTPYHIESWLFRYSPSLRYSLHPRYGFEVLRFPIFYERVRIRNVYAMHMRSVKSLSRMLERRYEVPWILAGRKKLSLSFEEYFKDSVQHEYGTRDINAITKKHLENIKDKIFPYRKELYGDYPTVLKKYVEETFNSSL